VSGQTQIGRLRAIYPDICPPWPERDGWVLELWRAGLVERSFQFNRLGYLLTKKGKEAVERGHW
jgi:hypothetical protein